jgi:protein TonB
MLSGDSQPEDSMLAVLLESKARRERRAGGAAASLVAHGALIALAAAVTGAGTAVASKPSVPEVVKVSFAQPPTPQVSVAVPAAAARPAPAPFVAPRIQSFTMPTIIPTSLPETPLTVPRFDDSPGAAYDFSNSGSIVGAHGDPGAPGGPGGSGGPAFLTAEELQLSMIGRAVPPRYPETLRRAGIEGNVTVRFVVDTTGRIDPASVEIVQSTHDLFSVAAKGALSALRFQPTRVNGRVVRAAAMLPFVFTLSR